MRQPPPFPLHKTLRDPTAVQLRTISSRDEGRNETGRDGAKIPRSVFSENARARSHAQNKYKFNMILYKHTPEQAHTHKHTHTREYARTHAQPPKCERFPKHHHIARRRRLFRLTSRRQTRCAQPLLPTRGPRATFCAAAAVVCGGDVQKCFGTKYSVPPSTHTIHPSILRVVRACLSTAETHPKQWESLGRNSIAGVHVLELLLLEKFRSTAGCAAAPPTQPTPTQIPSMFALAHRGVRFLVGEWEGGWRGVARAESSCRCGTHTHWESSRLYCIIRTSHTLHHEIEQCASFE